MGEKRNRKLDVMKIKKKIDDRIMPRFIRTGHKKMDELDTMMEKEPRSKEDIEIDRTFFFGMAGFSALSILILVGIGIETFPLKIALFCFSFCIPYFITQGFLSWFLLPGKDIHLQVIEIQKHKFSSYLSLLCITLFGLGFIFLLVSLSIIAAVVFISSVIISYGFFFFVLSKIELGKKGNTKKKGTNKEKGVKNA